jgi:hypothetical protein
MNKLYVDQTSEVNWAIKYLDKNLRRQCLNSADTGVCDLIWKHEDCRAIMDMLFDLTQDDKYKTNDWVY